MKKSKIILIILALIGLFIILLVVVGKYNSKVESSYIKGSAYPSNTIPTYGFSSYDDYKLHRGEQQAKIDDDFIATVLKSNPNTVEDSNYLVQEGFEYLQNKDPDTAMKRFNQGWLIDHNNFNVYWGFATVSALKNGNESAIKYFEMALDKFDQKYDNSVSSKDKLICDVTYVYSLAYADSGKTNTSYLEKIRELTKGINIQNAPPQCVDFILINGLKN